MSDPGERLIGAEPTPATVPAVLPPHAGPSRENPFGATDVLLVCMAAIWGVNFSVVKYGTQLVPALAFNGARMILASLALAAIALSMAHRVAHRVARHDALALLGLGVLGNGIYQFFFVEGIALTRAGNAALMLAATPAMIALIGRLRGVERASARALVGIALSIGGIGAIMFSTAQGRIGDSSLRGDMLVLAGCVSWALYTVLLQPYTHRIHGVPLSAITMVGGTVPLVLVASPAMLGAPWGSLSLAGWSAILYSGIGALVLAYLFWYRGVRVLGPTRTAMYGNLQPLIALLVAWWALAERPTLWQWLGAAAILGGLFLTRTASR